VTGRRVVIPDGREGIVTADFRDHGCGCRTVIVRLDSGREWVGKRSEVRPA
jgi:hypothetical protein